ncbi:MAG: hypothetical protein JWP27_3000, partial [Flaviaesturariibacter sp.]|nr:hypothetical protein [Flaviaesturariibacter sp.]
MIRSLLFVAFLLTILSARGQSIDVQ